MHPANTRRTENELAACGAPTCDLILRSHIVYGTVPKNKLTNDC